LDGATVKDIVEKGVVIESQHLYIVTEGRLGEIREVCFEGGAARRGLTVQHHALFRDPHAKIGSRRCLSGGVCNDLERVQRPFHGMELPVGRSDVALHHAGTRFQVDGGFG
jgi:hypothetical protein